MKILNQYNFSPVLVIDWTLGLQPRHYGYAYLVQTRVLGEHFQPYHTLATVKQDEKKIIKVFRDMFPGVRIKRKRYPSKNKLGFSQTYMWIKPKNNEQAVLMKLVLA